MRHSSAVGCSPSTSQNPRESASALYNGLFLLENIRFDGRSAEEMAKALPNDEYRREFIAEVAFFQNDTDRSLCLFNELCARGAFCLSATHATNLSYVRKGNYDLFTRGMDRLFAMRRNNHNDRVVSANVDLAKATTFACLYTTNRCPEWLKNCEFSRFPENVRPFLTYVYARYLHGINNVERMLGVIETALALYSRADGFTVPDLYLRIMRAVALIELNRGETARAVLRDAFLLARPYKFFSPFIECISILRGELETVLKNEFPDEYKYILSEWKTMLNGWMSIHNRLQNSSISTVLTLRELQIGLYMCDGLSYKEISSRTGLSIATINNYMQNIRGKLGVKTSKDAIEYIRWM